MLENTVDYWFTDFILPNGCSVGPGLKGGEEKKERNLLSIEAINHQRLLHRSMVISLGKYYWPIHDSLLG